MSGPTVDKPDIASIRLCSNFIPVAEKPRTIKDKLTRNNIKNIQAAYAPSLRKLLAFSPAPVL